MKTKLPVVVNLKEPCPMRWEDMQHADAGRRFCHVCQKHVFDLSTRSADEVRELLKTGVCVNFEYRDDGSVITRERKRRRTVIAAALVALTGCGSHHAEDADYPRLGGAVMPDEVPPEHVDAEAGAAGAAGAESAPSATKASCDH